MALIENGSLAHTSPTYLASPAHYHTNSSQQGAPTMEIVDDYIEYVDPVLRTPLPVLPPQMLPPYHPGIIKFNSQVIKQGLLFMKFQIDFLNDH